MIMSIRHHHHLMWWLGQLKISDIKMMDGSGKPCSDPAVRPDLAKFRHLGTLAILKVFMWYLANFWIYFSEFLHVIGKFSLLLMATYWTSNLAIWSHCSDVNERGPKGKNISLVLIREYWFLRKLTLSWIVEPPNCHRSFC